MPTFETRKGLPLYFKEHGSGEPVLLLHGLTSDHSTWNKIIKPLSEKYKVVVSDLRGHGKSGLLEGAYVIDDYAKDLKELNDYLGVKEPVICGHSVSGAVAMSYAQHYPAKGLFLYAPLYSFGNSFQEKAAKALLCVLRKDPPFFSVGAFRKLAGFFSKERKEIKAYQIHGKNYMSTDEFLKTARAVNWFEPKQGNGTSVGVLLGKNDPRIFYRQAGGLRNLYEDVQYFTIEGGHHLQKENPKQFCGALCHFIDELDVEKNYKPMNK